jgi:geranylgeranyl pyrophosphate synthase
MIIRKGVVDMAKQKKKRRRHKPTAQARYQVAADILAGTISGLIVLAIQKLLDW